MSKSCQRIVIVLLIVLLLILSVSLYYVKSIATSLKEQGLQKEKKIEKQMDDGQLIGVGFFFYFQTDSVSLKGRVARNALGL